MTKRTDAMPHYGKVTRSGNQYYRTSIYDENRKRLVLYASTPEELFKKKQEAEKQIKEVIFHRENPTVKEYSNKWIRMQSSRLSYATLRGYSSCIRNYIIKPLGDMYMSDVTADDIQIALIPVSKRAQAVCNQLNMLIKAIFKSAERSGLIDYNPAENLSAKKGLPPKERGVLTDEQVTALLDAVRGLRPYVFIMLALYAGLRREEILALQWDCVHLDAPAPYISVRRAWRMEGNKLVVNNILKTPAAKRDIPIPDCLVKCLQAEKEKSNSKFVISDSKGNPLRASQYQRLWAYVIVRSTKKRYCYKYVNGQSIKCIVDPLLGKSALSHPNIKHTIDFEVTPHMLRHTYITNLIHDGVDPKTVQYLAGHENSKTTMDIYAKVKYNKPKELSRVVNAAFKQNV